MAQVKFYSKSALPSSGINDDGVYFINGGELYKGVQRFGLARITNDSNPDTNLTLANGAARGDINVYEGTAKVFNGTSWIALTDGALAAKVSAIETVVSIVTSQEPGKEPVTTKTVTANTGIFTTNLTVGESTINQIAQAEITAATLSGSILNSQGTSLVTEGQVIDYVDGRLSTFGNVMHFAGVVDGQTGEGHQQYLPATGTSGDIWVITGSSTITAPETGYAASPATVEPGQEYVWDGTKWEVIGDQNTYATATTVSTLALRVSTIESTISSLGDAAYASIFAPTEGQTIASAATSSDLVTASQVYDYVTAEVSNLNLGTAAQANVLTFSSYEEGMGGETWSDKSSSSDLVTASQVWELVSSKTSLDASAISFRYENPAENPANLTSQASNVNAAIVSLDDALVTANSNIAALQGSVSAAASYAVAATPGTFASDGTALPTEAVVYSEIANQIGSFASTLGGSSSATASGITVEVETASVTASASVSLTVVLDTEIGPSQTIPASGDDPEAEGYTPEVPAATDEEIPSSLAVRKAIDAAIANATLEWITDDDDVQQEP